MTARIIPFLPAHEAGGGSCANLASGAACRPAAIPYSALGNPSNRFDKLFDPIAFNDALYGREIEVVREVMAK